jgi:curved DNA-binding protein CbpA
MVKGGFYEILGVPFEASEEEVKSRYRDLSLQNHSDKGGGDEEFGKIASAYEVLGNPHQRLKYDLGLLKEGGKGSEYVESEKLGEVYKNSDLVDDELSSKISVLLMKELEDNDLRVEDLSKYSNLLNGSYRVVLLNRNSKEVGQVSDFCQRKVKSSNFQDAIINVRKYLEVIENTFSIKRAVISALENIMPYQELSETYPSLSKEELDDYEGQNEFDSYPEKVESRILKRTYENREESISRKLEEFRKEVELLKVKIEQKRKKKEELLQELDKRLEDGDKLLYDEIEDKQEKITSFINDFSNYLNLMKENDDYPTKIISQAIQKEKSNEIDSLITQLEN